MPRRDSTEARPLRVLVIGAGMYTCGRGTDGYGTVLPAIMQYAKDQELVDAITVCATTSHSADILRQKADQLGAKLNVRLPLELWPREGTDPLVFHHVVRSAAESGRAFDCAIVAVPDHLHYEIAKFLLENNIHTLIVKPFVTQSAHGRELIDLAERQGLLGMVEFHKRWDQSNLIMRDLVRGGRVGQPLYFHIEYSQRKCIPEDVFTKWVRQTNIFQYLGVHYADMVHFVTGAMPRRVLAIGQKSWLAAKDIDTFDAIQTVIEWEAKDSRFVSTHLTNWIDPDRTSAMSDQRIKVVGTEGRVECDQKDRGVQVVTDRGGVEDVNPYFSYFYDEAGGQTRFDGYGLKSFVSFFEGVRAVISGETTASTVGEGLPTFRSSLVSTAIVEANNWSLERGNTWVEIDG